MPEYEGLVTTVTSNRKAEVVIRPGTAGIVGAPEVSKKVCHTPTDGSTLRVDVVNAVGAEVGDWVSFTRPSGFLMKNLTVLFGIPLLGGIIGSGGGGLLASGLGLPAVVLPVGALMGLLVGILVGRKKFGHLSQRNRPFISRVLKTRSELAHLREDQGGESGEEGGGCNLCSGCFPS